MAEDKWELLKQYLNEKIESDYAVMTGFRKAGDEVTAGTYGALVSANRSTLGKMLKLEAGRG